MDKNNNKKNILWLGIILVLLVVGYMIFTKETKPQAINTGNVVYTSETFSFVTPTEENFTVQYSEDADYAKLKLNGNSYVLNRAVSASGTKYTSDNGSVVFIEHQDKGFVEIDGKVVMEGAIYHSEQTENENPLTGKTWQWQETQYNNDDIVTPNKKDTFTISFNSDNTFSATTDCNNLLGTYKINSEISSVEFGSIASTKMACPDKENQETVFAKMLEESNGYLITRDGRFVLTLKYDTGSVIFTPSKESAEETEQTNETAETTTEVETFSGKLEAVDTACFSDGICSATIDGKMLVLLRGWSQDTVGSVKFEDGIVGLESNIGKKVNVHAAKTNEGYTLYGSKDYYIEASK